MNLLIVHGLLLSLLLSGCFGFKISMRENKADGLSKNPLPAPICTEDAPSIKGITLKIESINSPNNKLAINGMVEIPYHVGTTPLIPARVPRALLSLQRDAVVLVEVFPSAPNIFSVAVISYVTKNGQLAYSSTAFVILKTCEDAEMSITDDKGNVIALKIRLEFLST